MLPFFFFPLFPFIRYWLPLPSPACLIGIVSMAKVGIVGQRGDAKPEGDTVELGER